MTNKIWVWGVAFLVVLHGAGYYFFVFEKSIDSNPFELIPGDAAVIIRMDDPARVMQKFNPENEIWKSLAKSEAINRTLQQMAAIDSIVQSDPNLASLLAGPLTISLHNDSSTQKSNLLFLIKTENAEIANLKLSPGSHFTTTSTKQNKKLLSVTNDTLGLRFYAGIKGNTIVLSAQQSLVHQVMETGDHKKNHFSQSDAFLKLVKTAGSKTDANIYVNYRHLFTLLHQYLKPSGSMLNGLDSFADWTETDLLIKEDGLLFSGFTVAKPDNTLSAFAGHAPNRIKSYNIAPNNTLLLFTLTSDDIYDFVTKENLEKISRSVNFDLKKWLATCDNEISLVSNAAEQDQIVNNTWAFVRLSNTDAALQYLNLISSNTGVEKSYSSGPFTIREIKTKNFVPGIFGDAFSMLENTWFTLVDDFVVFGNSYASLSQLARYYDSGKTLDLNENFKSFSHNVSGASNVLLCLNPGRLSGFMDYFLDAEARKQMLEYQAVLDDFQGLSVQFTTQEDSMFFTNLYTRNNKSMPQENLDVWRIELDNEISGRPFLVKDHTNNTYNIIVFDSDANIYLITSNGQVAWKKKLDALPESGISQMDFYKNGKIQYLLNTRDFIYLVDKNGENVSSFPQKINPSSTNGLSLLDYKNDKNYRILMAQADKRVYNYTKTGKKVSGWIKPKTDNIVAEPIVHLSADGLDYILITDISNNLLITDRRGKERIKLKTEPDKARNSTYYINQTNDKGILLTTDKTGRLTYISKTGKLQHTVFGEYSADHFFLYEDFTGNGYRDFIYVEGDQLNVFNRFKEVLFTYRFPAGIEIKPVFFRLGRNQSVLGVVDSQNKTIYLFDKHGNPVISSGLIGENPFTVGSLENDDEINLITSVGKTLFNYRIK